MGKITAASSSKAKPVSAKRTVAKATKIPAKKKTPVKSNGIGITKDKKGASTKTQMKVAVSKKKKVQPPMPKGWPVSSKVTHPAPRAEITVKNNDITADDTMGLDSDNDGSSTHHAPSSSNNIPSIPANYLTPGNLLQQSCNGSDVFLRKRAVQSTSMSFPSSGGSANNKGGPTRFLIVFPGRMSLNATPKSALSTNAGNDVNTDDNINDGKEDEEKDDTTNIDTKTKRKSPFAPTHPPQLLGKLVSLGGNERNMELRIPMPLTSESKSEGSKTNHLVMSGKAIPLSGKYMALSFKRTGGAKDSSSGGGTGKNKKRGAGSITCKDVFRSVIVLGDNKVVDDEGKKVVPQKSAAKKSEDSDVDEEKEVAMKHYGGSERTLDGGGKYNGGVTAGRKSLKSTTITAASRKRKDSISSKELSSSDESDEDIDAGSVSSDEFVPAAAKKKRKSSTGGAKRKATNGSDDDEEEVVAPSKKRNPRRSTGSVKVSYVENSDVDMDDDHSDDNEEEDESSDEEEDFKPKAKPKSISEKKPTKKTAEKAPVARKRGSTSRATKGGSGPVYNLNSDEEDESSESGSKSSEEDEEYEEPKAKQKNAKKPPAKKAAAKTKRESNTGSNEQVSSSSSTKKVANDIIEIDSGDDKKAAPSTPTKNKVVDEKDLQALAAEAKKRLSSLSTPEKSPPKSPIARGRRKKNTPKKKSPNNVGKENDLNLDDDPFTFLSQTD